MQNEIRSILTMNWALPADVIISKHNGRNVWNITDGTKNYILKQHNDINKAYRNSLICNKLVDKIPVPNIIKTVFDKKFYCKCNKIFYLYKALEGQKLQITLSKNYGDMMEYYGEIIGSLHYNLNKCNDIENAFLHMEFYKLVEGWAIPMVKKIDNKYFNKNTNEFSILLRKKVCPIYHILPRQLIHRDLNLNNLLFNDNVLTGIIDFELCQINIRIFDVCYFITCFINEFYDLLKDKNRYFEIIEKIILGYNNICELTIEEIEAFPYVLVATQLIFIAWFYQKKFFDVAVKNIETFNYLYKNISNLGFLKNLNI